MKFTNKDTLCKDNKKNETNETQNETRNETNAKAQETHTKKIKNKRNI